MTDHSGQPQVVVVYPDGSSFLDGRMVRGPSETVQVSKLSSAQKAAQTYNSENVYVQKYSGFPHDSHAEILDRGDAVRRFDPHKIHREFPLRWMAYINANYSSILHIQQVFGCSESCARKWWGGKGGVNGGNVAIARRKHPVAAEQMLFAAE